MGQLLSTHHSKPLDLSGYFLLATLQTEVAFFIASKNPILSQSFSVLSDNSIFECPTNVPFIKISNQTTPIYLGKVNPSQGMYNHLLSILDGVGTLLPNFYKEII